MCSKYDSQSDIDQMAYQLANYILVDKLYKDIPAKGDELGVARFIAQSKPILLDWLQSMQDQRFPKQRAA